MSLDLHTISESPIAASMMQPIVDFGMHLNLAEDWGH